MCSRTPSRKMRGWPPTSRSSVTSCSEPLSALSNSQRTLPARSVALMIPNVGRLWSPTFLVSDERGYPGSGPFRTRSGCSR